jgi:excinuclease ABC subunit B
VVKRRRFELRSSYAPAGDQPTAIATLVEALSGGAEAATLLGVTGSGKTFTLACVIEELQKPALIIAHNKTLATQLFQEFSEFFPDNAVEYFVSYYDYYQPEAYLPSKDVYIEKDARMDERLDKLRHRATRSLLTRSDVIIIASVSCIYGLGSPKAYGDMSVRLKVGEEIERNDLLRELAAIQYQRNDIAFQRGSFRVRGDVLDLIPAHEDSRAVRVEFFGDEIERVCEIDPLTGELLGEIDEVTIYPKSHYVTPKERLQQAIHDIEQELLDTLPGLRLEGRLVEAQRLEERTRYDLEMLREAGVCSGIENYSRHLTGRGPGEPPPTLFDYFPEGALLFIDESHQTVSQIGAMYRGDRSRKESLVRYGFRLPSALDNRPMTFEEWEGRRYFQRVFVSATPRPYELELSGPHVVEQIVRPTGLVDPPIELRPTREQVHDLKAEVDAAVAAGERVLVTTLTKRMAEDLSEFYLDAGMRVKYLHSDIDTIERGAIIKELRAGVFDCLIGINLLREGLDLPEVALVAVLDADKEGFLRNETSLIQTCGRAARNVRGRVIFYADVETRSIKRALAETERRRKIQLEYNERHGITPWTVGRPIEDSLDEMYVRAFAEEQEEVAKVELRDDDPVDFEARASELERAMREAAERLEFELAARLRDQLQALERRRLRS